MSAKEFGLDGDKVVWKHLSEGKTDSIGNVDVDSLEEQERLRYKQDTGHRKKLVVWVRQVTSLWLFAVIVLLALHGANVLHFDTTVLVTLLATTTANVLGLALIVLKGLFPKPKE